MLKLGLNTGLWSFGGFNLEEACKDISNLSLKYVDLFTRLNCDPTTMTFDDMKKVSRKIIQGENYEKELFAYTKDMKKVVHKTNGRHSSLIVNEKDMGAKGFIVECHTMDPEGFAKVHVHENEARLCFFIKVKKLILLVINNIILSLNI